MNQSYYSGSSMSGTFRPGDIIHWAVMNNSSELHPGDVVVYKNPVNETMVVHRVIDIQNDGIRTAGDHSPEPDQCKINHADLLGKAVTYDRDGRTCSVRHGFIGLARRYRLLGLKNIKLSLRNITSAVTPFISWNRCRPSIKKVCFSSPNGRTYKYLWKRKVIAVSVPSRQIWQCRFPFSLFLFPPE